MAISLLSIVLVPLILEILSAVFPRDVWVSPWAMARIVLISVLVPLALGLAVHRLKPRFAERAAPFVSRLANLLLWLTVLPVLIVAWPAMRVLLGNGTALTITGVVAAGLLAGHLLGGPDPADRASLAIACATRHPGIALLIGRTSFPTQSLAPALLLFLVIGLLAAIPYQAWSRKHTGRA